MAKKASISAVRKPAITALCGGATNILLNRPTEKNVHATEEVDAIDSPSTTSSTSVDHQAAADARRESNLEHNESTISPYTCSPVAIDVGPGLATYWAPKHLLRSPRWSTTDAGGIICLPGVSADTGHTLVHYLYTGTYQTLEARREDALAPVHIKFEQALLTFVLASTYELQDLEKLAKEQIEIYGSRMALVEVLDTVKDEFSKLTWSWLHKYLQARAEEQFDPDYTFFKSTAFAGSVGEGALQRFITSHVLELFSKRLTHALKGQESRCLSKEEPDALLEDVEDAAVKRIHCPCNNREHQTGMSTLGGDMSFEFPDVSRAEVNDVIFLENSVCDETPSTPPESEPVQPPETEPPAEILHEPVPDFEPVKEKKETELKEKEKEKATLAVAAMATNASTALSCAEPTANNDDWGSFAATTLGRKKKGKKGKVCNSPTLSDR
ncbi:hypothetical protein IQ06DRAFT_104895 [Phaeosphaeriaceae sp. SRC1lsM3a]|nr:hypothetical protein IQ06DRAFT_104895 [Stagonospora sp. SRC1lsM3a]